MKKRIILFFSMVALVIVCALGVNAEIVSGNCGANGDNVKWEFDTESGVLTISGQGDMQDYHYEIFFNPAPWYSYCKNILTVVIQDGITSIGEKAFDHCTKLTSITIPDSVTNIGDYAFSGCIGFTSIIIPDSVTNIGAGAFEYCTKLTSIKIPDSVTSIGNYAFLGCSSLTNITIPDRITSIGDGVFFDTLWYNAKPDGLIYINKVLYGYKGTMPSNTKIDITPGTVCIADYAFHDCIGLTSVTIPDSVTSIGVSAFSLCTGLISVTIENGVTSIGDYAFFGCNGLTSFTIPDSVTSIGEDAFSLCKGLISVTIGNSVTSIGWNAFSDCTGLVSITIPDSVTSIDSGVFSDCTGLTSITIPDSVTSIGWSAFSGCTCLTSVTIPNSVTSIGGFAFSGCTGLTSITIPDSVTSIGWRAFYNTPWYNAKRNGLIYINKVLYEYKGTMPSNTIIDIIPGTVSISDYAFYDRTGLTSITIPDSVTSIGSYSFSKCTGLTSITIPASVAEISENAFESTQLTDIYYRGTEKEWKNINILNGNDPLFQATLHCAPELPNQLVLTIGKRTAHAFGHTKINDVAPVVVNGRTMLPVRFLAENLGATVAWNEEKQLVTITGKNQNQEDVTILITIGAANAQINGQSVALEAPAFVDQNRTFMPVRLIAEALGASVDWNESEQKVIITKM